MDDSLWCLMFTNTYSKREEAIVQLEQSLLTINGEMNDSSLKSLKNFERNATMLSLMREGGEKG